MLTKWCWAKRTFTSGQQLGKFISPMEVFWNIFHDFWPFYYLGTTLHDPEGILGHLTSCYLTYLGLQAGKWFSYYPNFKEKKQFRLLAGHFIAGALIIGTIGTILATAGSEYLNGELIKEAIMPINKNLWSVSFVMVTGAMGYCMLFGLFLLTDYWQLWNGAPFYYAGRNSILIYLLHSLVGGRIPLDWEPVVS